MRAADFSNFLSNSSMLKFGILTQPQTVSKLRELADRIEKAEPPRIALQEAYFCEEARLEDFVLSHIAFTFAELQPNAPEGTKLYGGEAFPIEVKQASRILTEDEVAAAITKAEELKTKGKK